MSKIPSYARAGDGRWQKRNERRRRRRSCEQNAEPGLPADGADVAAGPQQDGIHSHRLRRIARHNVQRAPPAREHLLPGPGEHAPRGRLSAVRQVQFLVVISGGLFSSSSDSTPDDSFLSFAVAHLHWLGILS